MSISTNSLVQTSLSSFSSHTTISPDKRKSLDLLPLSMLGDAIKYLNPLEISRLFCLSATLHKKLIKAETIWYPLCQQYFPLSYEKNSKYTTPEKLSYCRLFFHNIAPFATGPIHCKTLIKDYNVSLISVINENTIFSLETSNPIAIEWNILGNTKNIYNHIGILSPKYTFLASLDDDHQIVGTDYGTTIYHTTTKKIKWVHRIFDQILNIAIPNNNCYVSGHIDGSIKVWDSKKFHRLLTLVPSYVEESKIVYTNVTALAALNEQCVISGNQDGVLRLWDIINGKELKAFGKKCPKDSLPESIISITKLDTYNVLVGYPRGKFIKWNIIKGEEIYTLEKCSATCIIALNKDCFATGSTDGSIKVWGFGKLIRVLKGHTAPITCMVMRNDRSIVSGSLDKTIKVWDVTEIIN